MKNRNTGFSLIELMIVIAIIGILAVIAVPSYQTYVKKTKVAMAVQIISHYNDEIASNYNTTGQFPADLDGIPLRTPTFVSYFPSDIIHHVYWDNNEPSPNGYLKGYFAAVLTDELGGGIISIVPYVADPAEGVIFSCGIWDGSYAGTSVQYFPQACNELNQANL